MLKEGRIKISELKPHPKNSYYFDDMVDDVWDDFLQSVRTSGVTNAITITQDKTIISGHQRVRACNVLGIEEISYKMIEYTDEQKEIKDLIESNLKQRVAGNSNPVKLGRCFTFLKDYYGIAHGGDHGNQYTGGKSTNGSFAITQKELAEQYGYSIGVIKRAESLTKLPQEIQDLVQEGTISVSTASRLIARLSPEEQEQLAASLPATEKLTQKQVQQYIRDISDRDVQIGEQANELVYLRQKNHELQSNIDKAQKPETITIDNTDYLRIEQLESKVRQLESQKRSLEMQSKINQEDAEKFKKLKSDIEFLTQQKSDLSRQIDSATQLAELTVTLQTTLERDLAPIKFMRCMERLDISDVARQNLVDIVNLVDKWSAEMHSVLSKENIVMVDYGGTENR